MMMTTTKSMNAIPALPDGLASEKHCVFRSGDSWFSMPAIAIREIAIAPPLVQIPQSDPLLAGLCHFRSEFIPVVLLNSLLDDDESDDSQRHNKLLVIHENSTWGILVTEATVLESLETIMAPESRLEEMCQTPVMGTAMWREQIVRVLDPKRIFRLAQQSLEDAWGSPRQSVLQSRSE